MDNKDENVKHVLPYSKPDKAFNILIPTLLISKMESQALRKAVKKHNQQLDDDTSAVVVSLSFPIVKKEKADVKFKIDLCDSDSVEDIIEILYTFDTIKKKVNMTPVFNFELLKGARANMSPYNCLFFGGKDSVCTKRPGKKILKYFFRRR